MKNSLALHNVRHLEFATWVRKNREARYRSALEFWRECMPVLKMSYPHYATIEAGRKIADASAMIRIARALETELEEAAVRWVRDLFTDEEARSLFPNPGLKEASTDAWLETESAYVFQDGQAAGFARHPEAWDIVELLKEKKSLAGIGLTELARELNISKERASSAIDWLRNEGVVISIDGKFKLKPDSVRWPIMGGFAKAMKRVIALKLLPETEISSGLVTPGREITIWRKLSVSPVGALRYARALYRFHQEIEQLRKEPGPEGVEVAVLSHEIRAKPKQKTTKRKGSPPLPRHDKNEFYK